MDLFTNHDLKTLLAFARTPCLSLYVPTRRNSEEAPIRWKNALREAKERLEECGQPAAQIQEWLAPAQGLLEEAVFWKEQSDGLAAFLAPGLARFYRLPIAFEQSVHVARHFFLKPLIPMLSGGGRYYVLALSQNGVRLLQGAHFSVQELGLKGVPANLSEALRFHDRDETLTFHTRTAGGTGSWGAIFSGHGVGIDDFKDDLRNYFQQIDRGLHETLRNERAPLVLASVEYLWPIYRKANTYPHLQNQGIAGTPDHLSARDLHAKAWEIVRPLFLETQNKAVALFEQCAGTGRTSAELEDVLPAAHQGQVASLFLTAQDVCWGTFDAATGHVTVHEEAQAGDEDLVNLAAVYTLLHEGAVYQVRPPEVPADAPMAALFRVPVFPVSSRRT